MPRRCWVLVVLLGGASADLSAQAIPKTEYLRYVPLEYPRLVRQTPANTEFELFGDRTDPAYRDVAPMDGIDDRRGQFLHDLSVRFAPYLVRNTVAVPMDFRRFMEGSNSFPLYAHTWDVASAESDIVKEQTIDLLRIPRDPCPVPTQRTALAQGIPVDTAALRRLGGIEDCALLRLLDEFDPDHPINPRFNTAAVAKGTDPFTVLYYDFPGTSSAEWSRIYENALSGNMQPRFQTFPKIYSHPFVHTVSNELQGVIGYELVIQYWFFYPYNDGGNNHVGDWEHLNVVVAPRSKVTQNLAGDDIRRMLRPSSLDDTSDPLVIRRIEYYFHHKLAVMDFSSPNVYQPREDWEAEVAGLDQTLIGQRDLWSEIRRRAYWDDGETVINTNPIGYIGADNKGFDQLLAKPGGRNRDSHGTYPFTGLYKGVGPAGATEQIRNHFNHRKYYADTTAGLPATVVSYLDRDRVELLPDWEDIIEAVHQDVGMRQRWSWMVLPIRWGYPAVESPFAGIISHAETGNLAPFGPTYQSTWGQSGPSAGFELYEAHRFTSVFTLGIEDNFSNNLGYLNIIAVPIITMPPFDLITRIVAAPFRLFRSTPRPSFFQTDAVPFRFAGVSGGFTQNWLSEDFAVLAINNAQATEWLTRLANTGIDPATLIVDQNNLTVTAATGWHARFSIYSGKKFVSENSIQHARANTSLGFVGVSGGAPITFRVLSEINLWEWAGSFRYNIATGSLQPFLKLGAGISWYQLDRSATQVNDDAPEPLQNAMSPWIGKPGGSLSSFFPNTFHAGLGFEWLPLLSYAALPRGIDIGLRSGLTAYSHELGFNDIRSGLINPPPGETFEKRIWRPVLDLGLTVSF